MKYFNWTFDKVEDYISVLCFSLMSIVVLVAIFLRYVLFYPFPWGEEAARYLMVWGVFLGISIGVRKKAHLGVEAFVYKLPKKFIKHALFVSQVIMMIGYLWFAYLSIDLVLKIKATGQTSASTQIPMYYIYAALPVGLTLSLVRQMQVFWNDFFSRNKDTSRYEEVQI
ncbi:MAG: TRAP transporter small permease [Negativicutes bacterium]